MTPIQSALAGIFFGEAVSFRNLTVVPLIDRVSRAAAYHTLDEALKLGGFQITEVSEGGSVPGLKVVNTLDRPVLLLDGEEVLGAKQNRVFNLTILAPAAAELLVPVSCVEAGRWSHTSPEFSSAPRAQYAAGRSARMAQVSDAMLLRGARSSDQSEVWEHIEGKRRRMNVGSPTRAMADIYERFSGSVEEYVGAFAAVEGQVGAVFALNGEVAGLEVFDAQTTLKSLLPKLVRSYALDAVEGGHATSAPAVETVISFLGSVAGAEGRTFPGVGLGQDIRIRGDGASGAALVADGAVVHLCAFPRGAASRQAPPEPGAAMRRASERRRNREG